MFFTFRDSIYELAKADKRIVLISTDAETGIEHMKNEMPDQYFDEGISEAHNVGMASGLASDGFIPFILNHASFGVRRCFEQIVLDGCLQERPIRIVGLGAGLATAHLGPTHTVIEDIAIMRALPQMTVVAPCDAAEMKQLMPQFINWPQPIYIRLGRFGKPIITKDEFKVQIGKAVVHHQSNPKQSDVLMLSTGPMTRAAVFTAGELSKEGISSTVLHMHTIKPLDTKTIIEHASRAKMIVTLEDHVLAGGFGSACLEALMDNVHPKDLPRVHRIGLPDHFIHEYGTQESLFKLYGLEDAQIALKIKSFLNK